MKTVLKHTWAVLTGEEKSRFRRLVLADICISILDILFLALLVWIIQFFVGQGNRSSVLFAGAITQAPLLSIGLFFVFFSLKNLAAYRVASANYRFTGTVAVRISGQHLANYQSGSYDDYIQTDSSVFIRKIALQPFEFCQYMLAGLQQIITQLCLVTLTITAILAFNARLFLLLLLILVPPVVLVFLWIKKRMTLVKKDIRSTNEKSFQYLLDALKAYIEGNIYHRNAFFRQRFTRFRSQFSAALFESVTLQFLPSRVIETFAILGLFVLIALTQAPQPTTDRALLTLGAFMAAAYKLIPGIVKLINLAGQVKAYEPSIHDLLASARSKQEVPVTNETIHSIEFENVSFTYPNQAPLLSNFSLTIKPGDLVGICGASGIGKTTILNLLSGFLRPTAGIILVNNRRPEDGMSPFRANMAYVRQQSFLINDTILRNITLQEDGYDSKQLETALKIAGLDEPINSFAGGIEKLVSENGKNISGGQQQRINIARAVYKDAGLLLLDEPFNELDECSAMKILDHLKALTAAGKMIVLVTHQKKVLEYCTQIVSLDD